ncbi:hypothetical protein ACQEVB_12285 [Pseudonocardia sp. CA-107938]|uniref:hypothetical protein n=1 Tax=Pseudonocardia sp. CA-107938 TaxID=3240021 RepID=UPI003D90C13F
MAEPAIPDRAIVAVLRPFVRATRPVLDGLRESDPFGLRERVRAPDDAERGLAETVLDALASVEVPGTKAWADMDTAARSRWWVRRVGRFTTLVAAVPGIGGALANRLPVSKAIGAAGQGLVLVAIAGEYGVHDEQTLVELLGTVLFRRDLAVPPPDAEADAQAAEQADEITGDLTDDSGPSVRKVAGAMWRLGRALFALEGELDKRPHGNLLTEGLGMLPVIGAVGKFLGEWSGIQEAAQEAEEWLRRPRGVPRDYPGGTR